MKISAIIQARTGSTRLPGKVLKKICGIPVLIHVIDRIKKCKTIDEIIIATTTNPNDDEIVKIVSKKNVLLFRGSEEDVLDRYYKAAKYFDVDIIVRVTSDDPLIDYRLVDMVIEKLIEQNADYSCNNIPPSYPYGLDCEAFTFKALERAWRNAKSPSEREHVTPYIRKNQDKFKIVRIINKKNYSHLRWTLDTQDDYKFITEVYEALYPQNKNFVMEDVLNYLKENNKLRG